MADEREPEDLIVPILRSIQAELAELKSDLAELKTDVKRVERKADDTYEQLDQLRRLMRGFWQTEENHEVRIVRLERRIDALEQRPR